MSLPPHLLARIVAEALQEDVGPCDITTESTIPASMRCRATIRTHQAIVVAGMDAALEVFKQLGGKFEIDSAVQDGANARSGDSLLELVGSARCFLTGERVALNILGRLCGIATLTRKFVDAAAGSTIQIADTRKTTPGFRGLEKYAVSVGGGTNHRIGLWDAILIKDNHVDLAGGIAQAVKSAMTAIPAGTPVEVEVRNVKELKAAIEAGAGMVLLDNFSPAELSRAAEIAGGKTKLEVSGGITIDRIPEIASLGFDRVSIGALTHSARSADLSMRVTPWEE